MRGRYELTPTHLPQEDTFPNIQGLALCARADLSVHSQAYLNKVARQLNERLRETLQFETPAERFNACVAFTGWTRAC